MSSWPLVQTDGFGSGMHLRAGSCLKSLLHIAMAKASSALRAVKIMASLSPGTARVGSRYDTGMSLDSYGATVWQVDPSMAISCFFDVLC